MIANGTHSHSHEYLSRLITSPTRTTKPLYKCEIRHHPQRSTRQSPWNLRPVNGMYELAGDSITCAFIDLIRVSDWDAYGRIGNGRVSLLTNSMIFVALSAILTGAFSNPKCSLAVLLPMSESTRLYPLELVGCNMGRSSTLNRGAYPGFTATEMSRSFP